MLTDNSLHVLTGSTSNTFGQTFLRGQNKGNGFTMWVADDRLFFCDRNGIWMFNGSTAQNIIFGKMKDRWQNLSTTGDADLATAGYDESVGIYYIYFPTKGHLWVYDYVRDRWEFDSFDQFSAQVVGPSLGWTPTYQYWVPLGTKATGSNSGEVIQLWSGAATDMGAAIATCSFTTGHI